MSKTIITIGVDQHNTYKIKSIINAKKPFVDVKAKGRIRKEFSTIGGWEDCSGQEMKEVGEYLNIHQAYDLCERRDIQVDITDGEK